MCRLLIMVWAALALSAAVISGCPQAASAETGNWSVDQIFPKSLPDKVFRLRATFETPPELTEGWRNYKRPPKVDAALVRQIDQIRGAVPSWHGIHQLAPGASGNAR